MAIKLNNFVNININHATQYSSSGSRNICTLVLFNNTIEKGVYSIKLSKYNELIKEKDESYVPDVFDSIYEAYQIYLDSFFENTNENSILEIIISDVEPTSGNLNTIISSLSYDRIVIASNLDYDNMKTACEDYNTQVKESSMEKKIFLTYLSCKYKLDTNQQPINAIIKEDIENLAIKFGNEEFESNAFEGTATTFPLVYKREGEPGSYTYTLLEQGDTLTGDLYLDDQGTTEFLNTYYSKSSEKSTLIPGYLVDKDGYTYTKYIQYPNPVGSQVSCYSASDENTGSIIINNQFKGLEMTMGAYLTKINIDKYESVQDYAFTQENFDFGEEKILNPVTDNYDAVELIKNNYNFIGSVTNKNLNLGGNDSKGWNLVNQFMLICLHQTLTEKIWNLLQTKLKYNTTSLNVVSSFITQEMQRYVDNGYLSTNKTWTGEDLYNEKGVLIIKKNTPLTLGYKFVISPLSTLSPKDMEENRMPLISILIADAYAIRKIEIDGTVF